MALRPDKTSCKVSKGLPPRPDAVTFARTILRDDIDKHRQFPASRSPVFYDRGVPDALYMLDATSNLPRAMAVSHVAKYPYNRTGFILPPWEAIYSKDTERDQTFREALDVYAGMKRWYAMWGYALVEVPKTDVERRADFIVNTACQRIRQSPRER
ncbi:AAA family ATPase [Arhodomonas sp. AD133]|uniref:AAA family ATPase n=1 Tax=Arhodomonas sp. AD133 TaxID=3415009 RepID=UPI003EB7D671